MAWPDGSPEWPPPFPTVDPPTYTAPATTDYVLGGYHEFDGTDEYIDHGRIPALEVDTGDTWTIAAWAKQGVSDAEIIFSVTDGVTDQLWIQYSTDFFLAKLRLGGSTYVVRTATTLDTTAWNHLVATCDGADITLFLNGREVSKVVATGSYPGSSATWSATTAVTIGFTPTVYFNGKIAEVAMWSTDQAANVGAIYNARLRHNLMDLASPPDLFYTPLTSFGDNPDGTAGGVFEGSGAGNDGTGVNMETADAVVTPTTVTSTLTRVLDLATGVVTLTKVEDVPSTGVGGRFP